MRMLCKYAQIKFIISQIFKHLGAVTWPNENQATAKCLIRIRYCGPNLLQKSRIGNFMIKFTENLTTLVSRPRILFRITTL
jgi:hypothetical protein